MKGFTTLPRLATPLSKPQYVPRNLLNQSQKPTTRTFVSASTFTPTQSLTASRILPYPSSSLYELIADIPSYPSFLPYCQSARIASQSAPDPTHKQRWPRTADLRVGWGPYEESFRSRIYCVPYTSLEACAGSAQPTIPASELPHYADAPSELKDGDGANEDIQDGALFTSLLTKWKLFEFPFKPSPPDGPPQEGNAEKRTSFPRTEVTLVIEAKFASAVYSALSQAAAPKVAGMMIEAFEKRAREMLGEGHGVEGGKGEGENRGRKTSTEGVVGNEGLSWNKHH